MKHIEVVSYNSNWPKMFEKESALIKQALGDNCINVYHIGSTSVLGLSAKPIIDCLIVVKNGKNSITALESIGYTYRGEMGIPFRYYFRKKTETDFNLHVYEEGNSEIELNVLFRDYLRLHPSACQEYADLKKNLLLQKSSYEKGKYKFSGYNLGKDEFIRKILKFTGFDKFRIMSCTHYQEWEEYHRICEEQIFKPINIIYNRNHPDFTSDNHYHFVLYHGTKIVCVAHIEFLNENEAAIRTFATDTLYKGHHCGSHMMELLEKWIKYHGRNIIRVHARLSAENFYRKFGFTDMPFDDVSISKDVIDLWKLL